MTRLSIVGVVGLVVMLSSVALAQAPAPLAPQPIERVDDSATIYAVPLEQAFLASAQVAATKWHVTFSDKAMGIVSFTTNRSWVDNRSEAATVLCLGLPDGRTQVQVKTQKASGRWFALGTGDVVRREFFRSLTARLRETGLLPAEPKVKK